MQVSEKEKLTVSTQLTTIAGPSGTHGKAEGNSWGPESGQQLRNTLAKKEW